ncbi:MAG: MFS transporter [Deltaproteobacteria bacterium]|nr:MFS transporter [Deltaproteobacteria bacterium]
MPIPGGKPPYNKGIFYGWWMALSCAIMNFFIGGSFFYGFTVFFNPIRQTFGWTAAQTSIAFTFQRLESGIAGPIVGFLVDRVGPRKLMVAGWITVGVSFFWMSRINSLWGFYGSFFLIAVGFSFGSFVVMNAAIANWFTRKRSRALTIVYAGFGLSGLLVPLLSLAVTRLGWRETLTIVALVSWLIGLPLSLLMRHKPDPYGYFPDGETVAPAGLTPDLPKEELILNGPSLSADGLTAGEAVKTRAFWLLSTVFFFQQIGTTAIIIHIVPYLESIHIPSTLAAMAVTGLTLCSLVGRVFFGLLGDFRDKRVLITITVVLQVIGMFILSAIHAENTWLVGVFLFVYGLGYGGPIPLRPALQADYFGTKGFGTILGLMSLVTMVAGLVSPVVAGMIFDSTGSYKTAWDIFALITLPAVPLMLLAKPPKIVDTKPD